jgi:hypothetical protein
MHTVNPNFTVFSTSGKISPSDVSSEGKLENAYVLAAFCALANLYNGEFIFNTF